MPPSPRQVAALADEIEEMWNGAKAGGVSRLVAVTAIGMAVVESLPTIIAALRTAGTGLAEAEDWRPIAEAPTDGSPIWAKCDEAQSPKPRITYWHGGWQVIAKAEKFCPAGPHRWWPTEIFRQAAAIIATWSPAKRAYAKRAMESVCPPAGRTALDPSAREGDACDG